MWTSDIINALEIFEKQFNDGNTECIENVYIGMFGHIIVEYGGHLYVFVKDKWFKREGNVK